MDLLYSRHPLPYLHYGAIVRFPLEVRIGHPSQHSNSLLCLLLRRHVVPQVASGSLNFQFSGIIVSWWKHSSLWNEHF